MADLPLRDLRRLIPDTGRVARVIVDGEPVPAMVAAVFGRNLFLGWPLEANIVVREVKFIGDPDPFGVARSWKFALRPDGEWASETANGVQFL